MPATFLSRAALLLSAAPCASIHGSHHERERAVGGHIAKDCEFFQSLYTRLPERSFDDVRSLFTPNQKACRFPRQLFWMTGAGDTYMSTGDHVHEMKACITVMAWIGAYLGTMATRLKPKDWNVIDVGANVGQEAVVSSVHGFNILSFEPFPHNWKSYELNTGINCLQDVTRLVRAGTGDKKGSFCLGKEAENYNDGRSHVSTSVRANTKVPIESSTCLNITTVDIELEKPENADYLARRTVLFKLDNEGNELATMRAALKVFDHPEGPPPVVLYESIKKFRNPMTDFLQARGYRQYSITGPDAIKDFPIDASYYERGPFAHQRTDIYAVHMPTFLKPEWSGILNASRMAELKATM